MASNINNVLARSEITLVDIIDSAIYIYYADDFIDDEPVNVSNNGKNKNYIGIYNGEALAGGQPPANSDIYNQYIKNNLNWSKYVGDSLTIVENKWQYVVDTQGYS